MDTNEYIEKRCEESIFKDEKIKLLNVKILELEQKIKETMDQNQIAMFLEYEKLIIEMESTTSLVSYKQGMRDFMPHFCPIFL